MSELETRSESYSDSLVAQILANATGKTTAFATATGALEACAGLVGRAFASAEISGSELIVDALNPDVMTMIGRSLMRSGEIVLLIEVTDGRLALLPCESHDVSGGANPSSWVYACTVSGPESMTTHTVASEGVIHLTYAREPKTPWRGTGPLQIAALAGRLSAETVAALADESGGARANLIPIPADGEDESVKDLKSDIAKASGKSVFVQAGDWDMGESGGMAEWKPLRLGANPPASLVELADLSARQVYAACGINPAVFVDSQGTAAREAYRQALFGLVSPLGRVVAHELSRKLDTDVTLDWRELRASDIAGRARAFQSMVGAGMELDKAMALSGLLVAD